MWKTIGDYTAFLKGEWLIEDGKTIFKKKTYIGGKLVTGWVTRNGKHVPMFGGGKNKKGGEWKSFGTQSEAEAFVEDSKIKEDLYHGTKISDVNNIRDNGFKQGFSDAFGKGIYLTNKSEVAMKYANAKANYFGSKPALITTKVNLKNPLVSTQTAFQVASQEFGNNLSGFNKFINNVKKKHDGIIIEGADSGGKYIVAFKKEQVMVYSK